MREIVIQLQGNRGNGWTAVLTFEDTPAGLFEAMRQKRSGEAEGVGKTIKIEWRVARVTTEPIE